VRQHLRVTTERTIPGVAVHRLSGDLFGDDAGYSFQEQVTAEIDTGTTRVVLDLAGVTRLDSAGIGILGAIATALRDGGGHLVLAAMSERVEKTLGIVMFLDVVERAPSVEDALARL
jgi:anti-sigma B factor antagonist